MSHEFGDISQGRHAQNRGDLLRLITSLRNLGAQAELDLPRIVCIGNQSAGKSSLVESISGINVPRDSGTCTRCPMECRLAPSSENEWSAQVTLRKEYDDDTGERLQRAENIVFGPPIKDSSDTEGVLRRAQLATLNPTRDPADFIDMDIKSQKFDSELEFSKNVVCIDITAPGLSPLVFIDLPGIIQNADQLLIDVVEDMVTDYISGESIILVAIPMTDDLQNQKAARLAKMEDPNGLRTIVALTKVDLVGAASTKLKETWLDAIEGRGNEPLRHGYFATRQLDDGERGKLSLKKARELEKNFFATTHPWCSSRKDRFGIPNLTEKLSSLLAHRISESLPRIHEEVRQALSLTNKGLAALPTAITGEPFIEVLNLINSFCRDLKSHVEGERGAERLIQRNHALYQDFKIAIRSTRPNFRPFESSKDDNHTWETEEDKIENTGVPVYLTEVRDRIKSAKTRELPRNVPYPIITSLTDGYTSQWVNAVDVCLAGVRQNVLEKVEALIVNNFTRFSLLQARAREIIINKLEACFLDTQKLMAFLLSCESIPYTQNEHYFHCSLEKQLGYYKSARQRKIDQGGELEDIYYQKNAAISALRQIGYKVDAGDLTRLAPPDIYEEEMMVASQVQAYFKVSYKRIIDIVPMSIDRSFCHGLINDVQKLLISQLELEDKKMAASYVVEDQNVAGKREDLKLRKEKLEQARNQLYKFSASG